MLLAQLQLALLLLPSPSLLILGALALIAILVVISLCELLHERSRETAMLSDENLFDHAPGDVGEAELASGVTVGKPFVVESEQM